MSPSNRNGHLCMSESTFPAYSNMATVESSGRTCMHSHLIERVGFLDYLLGSSVTRKGKYSFSPGCLGIIVLKRWFLY